MHPSTEPPWHIYTGFWKDLTRGKVTGATLTLPSRDGLFLVAILALFVRWTGTRLWRIFCFVAFRMQATSPIRDGTLYDHQAMMRNSASASNAVFELLKIDRYWRRKSQPRQARFRSFGLGLLAIVHFAAFVIAGIFSARVTRTSSDVLLRSGPSSCGTIDETKNLKVQGQVISSKHWFKYLLPFLYVNSDLATSASYISACFLED